MSGNGAARSGRPDIPPPSPGESAHLRRLRVAARDGDPAAQVELAKILGVIELSSQYRLVTDLYRRAAEAGNPDAMVWLCDTHTEGTALVTANLRKAYRWAVRGAAAGSAWCHVYISHALRHGNGVGVDEDASKWWRDRAMAVAGNAGTMWAVYSANLDGPTGSRPCDPVVLPFLWHAAQCAHPAAMAELSTRLRDGNGMRADEAEANVWGLRAAASGDVGAQADMDHRLLFCEGIAPDTVSGVALLLRAVLAGNVAALVDLGDASATGLGGLPVDKAAARALYERAAAKGGYDVEPAARVRLEDVAAPLRPTCRVALQADIPRVCGHAACGAMLDAGTLSGLCAGCRALEEMEVWARMPLDTLRAAAESGTAAAQGAIGLAYVTGTLGLDKDEEAGLAWLRKAAAQGLLPVRSHLGIAAFQAAHLPGADSAARYSEALEWFRPVAGAGDAAAMFNAFVCCKDRATTCGDDGEAAPQLAEAGRWLRGAVALAEPYAFNALGVAAWDGDPGMSVARDRDEAARLFAAADSAGFPEVHRATRPVGAPGSTGTA